MLYMVMVVSKLNGDLEKIKCTRMHFPVGCVPAARWPYAGVCFPGGLSAPGGVWSGGCLLLGVWSGGGVCSGGSGPGRPALGGSGLGGCLLLGGWGVWSGGVCSRGSAPGGRGVCSWGAGVCSRVGISQHALRQTPPSLWTDRRLWKYYLGPTSLRPVKIRIL